MSKPKPKMLQKRISAKNASQSDWEDWGRVLKKLGSDREDFPVLWIAPGNLGTLGGDWEGGKRFPAFVYADTGFQTPAASQTIPAPQMNPGSSHYDSQCSVSNTCFSALIEGRIEFAKDYMAIPTEVQMSKPLGSLLTSRCQFGFSREFSYHSQLFVSLLLRQFPPKTLPSKKSPLLQLLLHDPYFLESKR
ncbi:hypothetical protein L596_028865 [Steinernema carpocapsae]|uniref:Uncharacterized protein n=1 Tax=Steinernema carpocapsae TaxID=34508 RepID=A0A4U5LZL6_STECR|nr:hypothetical protein L596_028865 [Steinernema carpocapsae]